MKSDIAFIFGLLFGLWGMQLERDKMTKCAMLCWLMALVYFVVTILFTFHGY